MHSYLDDLLRGFCSINEFFKYKSFSEDKLTYYVKKVVKSFPRRDESETLQ